MESTRFAHLHVHTAYSLLDGACRISDLVSEAKRLGMDSLAITDHGNMYGAIEFYKAARKAGVHPVIGCEVYVAPRSRTEMLEVDGVRYNHLTLLAEDNEGYRNLTRLVSLAHIEGMYYKPRVDKELLRRYHRGLICLSGCVAGELPRAIVGGEKRLPGERIDPADVVREFIDLFGRDNYFLEMQWHTLSEESASNARLRELAAEFGLGLVATNDVHYVRKGDAEMQDVLLCIQTGKTRDDEDRMQFRGSEFYLKSPEQMAAMFGDCPEAIANTVRIAERCRVDFDFGRHYLPVFPLPADTTAHSYLRQLCEDNLGARYPGATPEVRERLGFELSVIHQMGFDSYFLIVWDFIKHARERGIAVGPGRGSAAGSIVAYLLGITDLDPLRYGLLFERFLNPERVSMPDIDVDFCWQRRHEVIEYVQQRYGRDHVAQIITFGTMLARGAVRDVGRVLGVPYNDVDKLAKLIPAEPGITLDKAIAGSTELRLLCEGNEAVREIIGLAKAIEGLPRQASTHAAGIVIAKEPLTEYMPVQFSDGMLVTAFDKDTVEELGLLKMDFLGLRTLTVIADTVKSIRRTRDADFDLARIPLADPDTARALADGQTSGVFQMESAGMTQLVKDIAPRGFEDLIPTVALYRPGPLGSGMVQDFIACKNGRRRVEFPHPLLEPILRETFGVILYQEQVMQIVQTLAGFTLGQADLLRRAMGHKDPALLMQQQAAFVNGAIAKGVDGGTAQKIFALLMHFAGYGFNKSHSAAYALLAWQTAYLKTHFPTEFMAAMLSSVMDNSEKVSLYLEQARRMGITVLPPDVNASTATFTATGAGIRFGLAAVRNVGELMVKHLEAVREKGGQFKSLPDFCARVDLRQINQRVLESLIKCGAFDSLGARRTQLLAVLTQAMQQGASHQRDELSGQMSLFGDLDRDDSGANALALPDLAEAALKQRLDWERDTTGFYITGHPLDDFAEIVHNLAAIGDIVAGRYGDGRAVRIGGLVAKNRRVLTKKGDSMSFLSVEDFTHAIEVVVFPNVLAKCAAAIAEDTAVVVDGKVDVTDTGAKVIANDVRPLADYRPSYYLSVDAARDTAATRQRLANLLADHAGDTAVFFGRAGQLRMSRLGGATPSPELERALADICGAQGVRRR